MNGDLPFARELLDGLCPAVASLQSELVVCVPHVMARAVAGALQDTNIGVGGQDVSEYESGAYTGETSAAMLVDCQCRYVIIGHSERRTLFGDTDERVLAKVRAALAAGLVPILCVGETRAEREAGQTEAVVARQLEAVLAGIAAAELDRLVVAYEPVWAIGTGLTATPEQAQAVHGFLRGRLAAVDGALAENTRILYGGSVKSDNAAELFAMTDIDGGLVGGASLKAAEFAQICRAADPEQKLD